MAPRQPPEGQLDAPHPESQEDGWPPQDGAHFCRPSAAQAALPIKAANKA
jgi:hypothetical protein